MVHRPPTVSYPNSCSSASYPHRPHCFPHPPISGSSQSPNTSKAASPSLRSSTEAGALRPRVSASAIATQPPAGKAATPAAPTSTVSPELPDTPMPQAEPDVTIVGPPTPAAHVASGPTTHSAAPPLESPPLPAPASPPDVPMTEVKHGPAIDTAKVGTPVSAATIASLRPIIHPSAEIDPSRGQLPAPLRPPPLHHIFAEAFSRLPSLLSIWGNIVEESGRALYHYLFSPTLVSDTAAPAVDEPLDEPLDVPPRRKEETIFSQLVSAYVDVPSSFDDPLRLSAPQVPADDSPITTFPPTTLTPPPFDPLVQHLHVQLQDHFVKLRAENVLHPHVTFIVGPPDHPNARYSLHSHLVGCYTTPYGYPSEYHTAPFVPTGPGQAWTGPAPSWYTSLPAPFGLTSPFLSSHQPLCSAHTLLMKSSSIFLTLRRPWCSSPRLPLSFVTTFSTIQVYLASLPTMFPLNAPILYPWPNLILDLKSYIPLLERHVITHMVAGRCNLQEEHSHPGYVLNSLLKDLAQTIVHNILFPATSAFMRPALPPRVATVEFWHAQLNYAVLRAEAALATGGSAEGIAGDQLCIWNTIAPDAIIPSTHLTLFLPPSLGAYVMANHQSHREFKPHPSSSASDIPTFTVQQGLHFPLPEVLKNQVELLNMARYAAADGYITPAAIPLLSHSLTGEHMTFQKIKWSLRFPLPTPDPSDPNRRFSSTPSFHNSPSSGEALALSVLQLLSIIFLRPPPSSPPVNSYDSRTYSPLLVTPDTGRLPTPSSLKPVSLHGCEMVHPW